MKVIKNYLYNVGYQVLAIIVPLITSAYVSRVLRPEGVGANSFTNSIIQYFILIANMGIGLPILPFKGEKSAICRADAFCIIGNITAVFSVI